MYNFTQNNVKILSKMLLQRSINLKKKTLSHFFWQGCTWKTLFQKKIQILVPTFFYHQGGTGENIFLIAGL